MNFFTKTRVLIGVIILLVAINVAVIGTIGFHFYNAPKELPPVAPNELQHAKFIANELNLTPEQREEFKVLRDQFMGEVQLVKREIKNTYKLSMIELSKDAPNNHILDSLSDEIAELHRKHHKITIEHFKKVKQVAVTPEQQEHFKRMFYRMMDRDRVDQYRKIRHGRRIDRTKKNNQ
jgi:Spy/CpxP family protein refolding chaperone